MRPITFLFVMVHAAGCDSAPPVPTPPAVTVTSDQASYRAVDTAVFTVHNGSQDTLYASLCGSTVEQATGPIWSYHDSYLCGSFLPTDDYSIAPPGRTAEVELADHFVRDLAPGTFRLRLQITASGGVRLPDSTRTSNAFDVVLGGGQ